MLSFLRGEAVKGRVDHAEKTNSNERLAPEMVRRGVHGVGKTLVEPGEARRPDFWDFRNVLLSLMFHRSFHAGPGTGERQSPVRILFFVDRTDIHMRRIHQPLRYLGNTGNLHRPGANGDPGSKPR